MTQHKQIKLRPYMATDAETVVYVVNAAAIKTIGVQQAVVDGVGNVRLRRYVPVSSEKVVALNPQNEVIAYAYLSDKEQHIVYEIGGVVHPDYWGQGIGLMLLNWAESRAELLSNDAPEGVKTVLQTNIFETEHDALVLFKQLGFTKLREWLHLTVELDAMPVVPSLVDGLQVREMDVEKDWDIVGPAMDEAFADHWGDILLPETEIEITDEAEMNVDDIAEDDSFSNAQGFCFLVMDDDTVAGGILCNNKLVEHKNTGRVGSLFVRPQYRRRGIGRTLMLKVFNVFWQHGIRRIITDTDSESFSETPRFYSQLGMEAYRREFLYEKVIRDGKEVRRLTL